MLQTRRRLWWRAATQRSANARDRRAVWAAISLPRPPAARPWRLPFLCAARARPDPAQPQRGKRHAPLRGPHMSMKGNSAVCDAREIKSPALERHMAEDYAQNSEHNPSSLKADKKICAETAFRKQGWEEHVFSSVFASVAIAQRPNADARPIHTSIRSQSRVACTCSLIRMDIH